MASQKIGVISTPNAGGMTPLTAFSKGCVGMTSKSQGISVTLVSGYQLSTTRANMAKQKKFRNGSKTAAVGWTQACVSAIVMLELRKAAGSVAISTGSMLLWPTTTDRRAVGAKGTKPLTKATFRDRMKAIEL
eukprot:scaffold710_cov171-Amphora_coffeaeformis.AAC.11